MIKNKIKLDNYYIDPTKIKYLNLDSYDFESELSKFVCMFYVWLLISMIAWGINVITHNKHIRHLKDVFSFFPHKNI